MVRFFLLMTCLLTGSVAFGNESYLELYQRGAYEEALSALESSADAQNQTPDYFFNRGVIYHALQKPGLAVANLEKAKSLSDDERVSPALSAAQSRLAQMIGASRLDAASFSLESWGDELPLEWTWMVLVVFSVLGVISVFIGKPGKKRSFSTMSFRVTVALMIGGALIFSWDLWMTRHAPAMVVQSEIIRSGPGNSYLERGSVETGMKIRLIGVNPLQGWYKVRFDAAGEEGFIPASSLLLLASQSNKS